MASDPTVVDDSNILRALRENWAADAVVSPGFERGAELSKYPGSHLRVVANIAPRSFYFGRFYYLVSYDLAKYFAKHNQRQRALTAFFCEWSSFALIGALAYYNYYPTLVCMIIPFNVSRLGMMSGNWTQHAFLARNNPLGGGLANSITVINTRFNAICFNDGYHASHHLNAHRHWTEHPRHFLENRDIYDDAIVLQNTDYEVTFVQLMLGRYDLIALNLVDEVGIGKKIRNLEDRVAWLKERTRQFSVAEIEVAKAVIAAKRGKGKLLI
ncbi:hypothetical protein HK100_003921 [Physocladia obscura]|uniref:Fatty acid desaturase domain-containing protein n=1 Tax=Physocladia obscura TaxID=109957 RepID=A0AAD5SW34_9FUNG|nr:hypothetical protein HK100_003921 [Physocladia obscura]